MTTQVTIKRNKAKLVRLDTLLNTTVCIIENNYYMVAGNPDGTWVNLLNLSQPNFPLIIRKPHLLVEVVPAQIIVGISNE